MIFREENIIPVPISDYAKKLDIKVRERYLQKILTIGIDPVLIEGKSFEPDCLPPVESTDLLCYLVLETSLLKMKQQQHDINLRRTRKKKIRVPSGTRIFFRVLLKLISCRT